MDTRYGTIYPSREDAERAGVLDEDLVTGSRVALEKLQKKLVFTKGSFKTGPVAPRSVQPVHIARRGDAEAAVSETKEAGEVLRQPV